MLTFCFASSSFNSFGVRMLSAECIAFLGLAGSALLRDCGYAPADARFHHGSHAPTPGQPDAPRFSLCIFWTPKPDTLVGGRPFRQLQEANLYDQMAYRRVLFAPEYCYQPCPVASMAKGCLIWIDGKQCFDLHAGHGTLMWGDSDQFIASTLSARRAAGAGLWIGQHGDDTFGVVRLLRKHSTLHHCMFTTTASQATALAVRQARQQTGRHRIMVFGGSWHGWAAELLLDEAHGALDARPLHERLSLHATDDVAAVVVEACAHLRKGLRRLNPNGPFASEQEWLTHVQHECRRAGVLFILDETVTGFRFPGGARRRLSLSPDMIVYGKSLGGGLPLAALMLREGAFAPSVYTAGTFVAHPLILGSALAFLRSLEAIPYEALEKHTRSLVAQLQTIDWLDAAHEGSIFNVDVEGGRSREQLETALRDHGVFVQTASFLFLSVPYDQAAVDEVARRWQQAAKTLG